MSEELPPQPVSPYEPSPEELRMGLVLNPDETVTFDISPNPRSARRAYPTGNGTEVIGQALAEIRIGSDRTFATGLVINTFNAPGRNDNVLVISSPNLDSEPFFMTMKLNHG